MTLQDIFTTYPVKGTNLEYKGNNTVVTVEGYPVWDYKPGKYPGNILLISEDYWDGNESDRVTLGELFDYASEFEIPFEEIKLFTEADHEILKTFTWVKDTLVLSHY